MFLKKFVWPHELKKAGVLNMNARNYRVIGLNNKRRLYPLVDDKVKTKELAQTVAVQTPKLIGVIRAQYEVKNLLSLVKGFKSFVIKPAHGSGGKGVLVIKKYTKNYFQTASEKVLKYTEVYQHISNILSGLYSLGGRYDEAILEEMVSFSDIFKDSFLSNFTNTISLSTIIFTLIYSFVNFLYLHLQTQTTINKINKSPA